MHLTNSNLISPPSPMPPRPQIAGLTDRVLADWATMSRGQRSKLLTRIAAAVGITMGLPASEVGEALGRRSRQFARDSAKSLAFEPLETRALSGS